MAQYYRKLSKGTLWFYKFSFAGQIYRSACIYHSKSEARGAEVDKYKTLDEKRRFPDLKDDMKLSELIKFRLDEVLTKNNTKYHKANEKYLQELFDYLGDIWVSDITRANLNSLLNSFSQDFQLRGKGNYTVNARLRIYKALFNFGIENFNLSNTNPCKGIKLFPVEKKLKYIPTDKEIEAVKLKCDKEQAFLIEFVKETGARINEALRLSGKDILENEIVLYTRKSKNSNLTPRKIPIPNCLIGKKYNRDEKPFGRWKEQPKFIDKKLRDMQDEDPTIKHWGWHHLRHRYASKLSKEGRPLFEIMNLLGHNNLETTQGYLQLLS